MKYKKSPLESKDRLSKPVPAAMDLDEKEEKELKTKELQAISKKDEGNRLYTAKKYREALALYTDAIDLDPQNAALYSNRSATYMMLKDYQSALSDAVISTSINPSFIKGYQRQARCHIALGSLDAASRTIGTGLSLDPGNKELVQLDKTVKQMRGFLSQMKDAREATNHIMVEYCARKLLEMSPDSNHLRIQQAEAMIPLKKFDDAAAIANDVLQIDVQNVEAIYVKAICLYYQDQTEKAYKIFQQILRMAPDFQKARNVYKKAKSLESKKSEGNNAFKRGDYKSAVSLYSAALEIDPFNDSTNAKLYNNRATAKCKLGQHLEAIEDCTKAIELDSRYLKALLRRAKCYMDTKQYEEAVRDYENVVKKDRSHEYRQLLREAKLELKKSKRKDYYKILGVSHDATDEQIKKAYRKEALKHHPDRHSHADEKARKEEEQLFKEVGEAYSVLSDRQKRNRYDSGQDLEEDMFSPADFDPNQIFQAFFGGSGGYHSFGSSSQGFPGGFSSSGFPGGFSFSFG